MAESLRLRLELAGEANAHALRERLGAAEQAGTWTETVPGILVGETSDPPPAPAMLGQFTLDGPPPSFEAQLTALIREVRAIAAELRALREEQQRSGTWSV